MSDLLNQFDYKLFLDESMIIREKKQIDLILDKIKIIFNESKKTFINLKLLYSASEDGDSAENFHSLCDGYAPLIVLVKTKKGLVFGGYTEASFASTKKQEGNKDDNAFIFSIDKMKTYEIEKGTIATTSFIDYGPVFSGFNNCNIYLYNDFFSDQGNVAMKGDRFNTKEDYEINGGEYKFETEELEVYQVIYRDN